MQAIQFGLRLAFDRGYKHLMVESDSSLDVSLIDKGKLVMWEARRLVSDRLDMVKECEGCMLAGKSMCWLIM